MKRTSVSILLGIFGSIIFGVVDAPLAFAAVVRPQPASYLTAEEMYDHLLFGSEMTVSSDELLATYPKDGNQIVISTEYSETIIRKMKDRLLDRYRIQEQTPPKVRFKEYHSNIPRTALEITYADGFSMVIFPDPGVLEMNTSPSSLREIEKQQERISTDYLGLAAEFGLRPALFTGAGHIHIDTRRLHPMTLRNFIVDFYNHTSLAAGALNEDIYNSIGIGEIPAVNKQILKKYLRVFDYLKDTPISYLINAIKSTYTIQYADEPEEYRKVRKSQRAEKYHALSFTSFRSLGTIEIRAIRPQASADSYLKLLRLFALKMKAAEENRVKNIFLPLNELKSLRGSPQEVLADFDSYLSDVGLHLQDYKEFILPWWQNPGGEYDIYQSKKTKAKSSQSQVMSCAKIH